MDGFMLPIIGIVAVLIAAVVLMKLFARKPAGASHAPAHSRPSTTAAKPDRHYPITTIGIPPGHVTPVAGATGGRSYPITTIGIPPGHVVQR
jgi:hypothetical protein